MQAQMEREIGRLEKDIQYFRDKVNLIFISTLNVNHNI